MGTQTDNYDVIIIGAGASGMCAAIFAAREGAQVLLIEHSGQPGRKILATGGGRCNLTNDDMDTGYFHASDMSFVKQALSAFGHDDTIAFFESLGLVTTAKDGYRYPRSLSASSVRTALVDGCRRTGVNIIFTDSPAVVKAVRRSQKPLQQRFNVTAGGETYSCKALVIAAGGNASPRTGSDGSGYEMLRELGHSVRRPLPALVGIVTDRRISRALAGLRMNGCAALFIDGHFADSDTGQLQFTDAGLSGIPVMNISSAAVRALDEGSTVEISLDLLPEWSETELLERIQALASGGEGMTLEGFMNGLFPEAAIKLFLKDARLNRKSSCLLEELETDELKGLFKLLKNYRLPVMGDFGYDRAQTTSGGADLSEIDPSTMESTLVKGLFIAGEIMDVDGRCGGYNLQWAWTSGAIAGWSSARRAAH